jgi:dihydrofolate synthase/folylpolyglutamate synthase
MCARANYAAALDFLLGRADFERWPGYNYAGRFDLRRMDYLLDRLGNPHLAAESVHIAGSKGKGSTAAMIAAGLLAEGCRTGLYTSPHLITLRERIAVDGKPVLKSELADIAAGLRPHVEACDRDCPYGELTTFELLTAAAFVHFKQKHVDFQVLETGLGGRLDATNVVTPKVCVITPIGLDHTDVLGNTIAEIAGEKAGIIKAGSTVVSSPQAEDAATVIRETCARMGATLIGVGSDITWERKASDVSGQALTVTGRCEVYETAVPLLGRHQLQNAATAVGALEVLGARKSAIEAGLCGTHWPGRLQVLRRRPLLVVDGAHTPDSARALSDALREYFHFDNLVLIIGASADKDTGGVAAELAPLASRVIATRSRHPRAANPEAVAREFEKRGASVEVVAGVAAAVTRARERATARDLICATGSLFLVAEVIEHIMGLRPELYAGAG